MTVIMQEQLVWSVAHIAGRHLTGHNEVHFMTFKDFQNTRVYKNATVIEAFSAETSLEYSDDYPDEELDKKEVVDIEVRGSLVTVVLKNMALQTIAEISDAEDRWKDFVSAYRNFP